MPESRIITHPSIFCWKSRQTNQELSISEIRLVDVTESGGGTKRMEVSKAEILRLSGEANEFSLGKVYSHGD